MQAAAQLHRTAHMVLVVVVEGNAAVDEARDLPAFDGILVDEGVVDAKLLRDGLRKCLACTIDDLIGAHTWVAIDIRLAAHREAKRQVREPLLDGHDALDIASRAVEHAADVVEDRGVDVLDEVVVELLQVGNGVELVDHARLVGPHDHAQFVEVRAIDVLPELPRGFGPIVLVDENPHEGLGERTVEVHVPEHAVLVAAADGHARDTPVARGVEQILVRLAREEHARVIGLEHVRLEDVFGEIVVRRADVGVPQLLAHEHEGGIVVAHGIFRVNANGHAELILEVEEGFLHIPHDDGDVGDAHLLKLANLPLDEHLAAHGEHAFGLLVGKRGEARGEARRHDDGVVDLVGRKRLEAGRRHGEAVHQTRVDERAICRVHRPKRQACCRRDVALRMDGFVAQRVEHLERAFRQCHCILPSK